MTTTIVSPIRWEIIRPALAQWLAIETGGLVVAWEKQNGLTQSAYPFCRLSLVSGPRKPHHDWTTREHDDATRKNARTVLGVRDITVGVKAFSDSQTPGFDAMHFIGAAHVSLSKPSVKAFFRESNMQMVGVGDVIDLSRNINGKWESVAAFDLQLRTYAVADDTPINVIEQAPTTIELYGATIDDPIVIGDEE